MRKCYIVDRNAGLRISRKRGGIWNWMAFGVKENKCKTQQGWGQAFDLLATSLMQLLFIFFNKDQIAYISLDTFARTR